jgi:hypothetical protein
MACFVWCELVCVQCASTVAGRFSTERIPRRDMSKEAKRCGWTLIDGEEWACPSCAKELDPRP